MKNSTLLKFTTIKNGHNIFSKTTKIYENTAGAWIDAVRSKWTESHHYPELIASEFDEDGDATEFTDPFNTLSVAEQLEICISVDGDANSSSTSFEVICE